MLPAFTVGGAGAVDGLLMWLKGNAEARDWRRDRKTLNQRSLFH